MHEFVGNWRITWMENWGQEYVNLIKPGYFKFTKDGLGEFMFGAVKGWIDVRVSSKIPRLEYSWEGVNDGDRYCGRGWFEFPSPDKGEGHIYLHCSDDSRITIERET